MRRAFHFIFIAALLGGGAFCRGQEGVDPVDRLDMKGQAAYDAKNYDGAIKWWSAMIKLDPQNEAGYFNRAAAYADKKETAKALADYSEAIRLNPKDVAAYQFRAQQYAAAHDNEKALADFGQAIALKPDAGAYMARADAYAAMGEPDKAIADYTEALRIDPATQLAYVNRGSIYCDKGEWDKAIADYTEEIKLSPGYFGMHYFRANAYMQKGDVEKALADVNEGLDSIARPEPHLLALRGSIYSVRGVYDKAVADFNGAMDADADVPDGFNAAAWFYSTCPKKELRDGVKAVGLAMKACELSEWTNDSFVDTLAAAEAEAGKWEAAVSYEKMAIKMATDAKENERITKDYASRIPLYEGKKAYYEVRKP